MKENTIYKTPSVENPDENFYYGWFIKKWILQINRKTKRYVLQYFEDISYVTKDELIIFDSEEEANEYIEKNLQDYKSANQNFN